jgi:hypothetical protein
MVTPVVGRSQMWHSRSEQRKDSVCREERGGLCFERLKTMSDILVFQKIKTIKRQIQDQGYALSLNPYSVESREYSTIYLPYYPSVYAYDKEEFSDIKIDDPAHEQDPHLYLQILL